MTIEFPELDGTGSVMFNIVEQDDCCTFDEIARLVSYTPDLNHLNIFHTVQNDSINEVNLSITLSKLIYLSIYGIFMTFAQLETFIKNIHQFYILSLDSEDITYLDADRWERFISQNLPQLEEFKLQYYEQTIDPNKSLTISEVQINLVPHFGLHENGYFVLKLMVSIQFVHTSISKGNSLIK